MRYLFHRSKVARCDRLKKKAGVAGRVNPHSFRHAFAREYLKNGGDVSILPTLMGHSDVNTTRDFYAVFKTDELADLHLKYSPIDHLDDTQEEDDEHPFLTGLVA
jgi:integrase/recombinase XerD